MEILKASRNIESLNDFSHKSLEDVATSVANLCLVEPVIGSDTCSTSNASVDDDGLGYPKETHKDMIGSSPELESKPDLTPTKVGRVSEGCKVDDFGGEDYFLGSSLRQSEGRKGVPLPSFGGVSCFSRNPPLSYVRNDDCGWLEGFELVEFMNSPGGSVILLDMLGQESSPLTWNLMSRLAGFGYGIPFMFHIMTNEFGSRVFSALIGSCSLHNFSWEPMIVDMITTNQEWFLKLSTDIYGSNSIKKVVKAIKKLPEVYKIVQNLVDGFYALMTDQIGSYLVLYCLNHLDAKQNMLLYEAAIENCLSVATHERGCVSLNSLIEKIQGLHRDKLLDLVSENAWFLSQDPLGNYVVQKVLSLDHPTYTTKICSVLKGRYLMLSTMKWSSHVVEKCLCSRDRAYVVEDFVNADVHQLVRVAKDQFGNYVIQTALKVSKKMHSPLHQQLMLRLKPYLQSLQHGYGKNIYRAIVNEPSYN